MFVIIFASMGTPAYAVKNYELETQTVIDSSTNMEVEVPVVNLLMSGQDVFTDVPAMLFEDRTLVPVRIISERLGAKIGWNQDTREVTITTDDKVVVLQVDSSKVIVNGKEKQLPSGVPAKLIGFDGSFRTMVPIRFVSEELNMEVGWVADTRTVTIDKPRQTLTDIRFEGSSKFPEIVLKTTGDVAANGFFLNGSDVGGQDKLIIDLPNVDMNLNSSSLAKINDYFELNIYENDVKTVKASKFSAEPMITRVVVDVDRKKGFDTYYDYNKKELHIKLINTVKSVDVKDFYGVDTVVVNTAQDPTYNVMFLENKIVIDVLDSLYKYDKDIISYHQGGINTVRSSQFTPDANYSPEDKISRIVIDTQDNITQDNVYIEDVENKIYVFVAGIPLESIDYAKETYNRATLALKTINSNAYSMNYDKPNKLIKLKVDKNNLNLSNLDMDLDDDIVEYIRVDDSDPTYYYIDIKLAKGTAYKESTVQGGSSIDFMFVNNSISDKQYNGKLIVLDPGHGGKDPGAVSPNLRVNEKDVNLEVSLKLKKLLENKGFKVYITRDDDTFVNLYDRASIANELNADLFVSVHANASGSTKTDGVMVLYYPKGDNKKAADIMRNALVNVLNTPNRGIIERPKLVVTRETKMTSVLLELGFLTNPREENLLSTKDYRNQCAKASLTGILNYFDSK